MFWERERSQEPVVTPLVSQARCICVCSMSDCQLLESNIRTKRQVLICATHFIGIALKQTHDEPHIMTGCEPEILILIIYSTWWLLKIYSNHTTTCCTVFAHSSTQTSTHRSLSQTVCRVRTQFVSAIAQKSHAMTLVWGICVCPLCAECHVTVWWSHVTHGTRLTTCDGWQLWTV